MLFLLLIGSCTEPLILSNKEHIHEIKVIDILGDVENRSIFTNVPLSNHYITQILE